MHILISAMLISIHISTRMCALVTEQMQRCSYFESDCNSKVFKVSD
jgi:hypothetical protein